MHDYLSKVEIGRSTDGQMYTYLPIESHLRPFPCPGMSAWVGHAKSPCRGNVGKGCERGWWCEANGAVQRSAAERVGNDAGMLGLERVEAGGQ